MDPLTAPIVLAGLKQAMNSASGEAGRQAWQGFVALARRALGHSDAAVAPEHAEALAETVVEAASRDRQLDADLRSWLEATNRIVISHNDSVSNSISGTVTNAIQARDISGPVTFH